MQKYINDARVIVTHGGPASFIAPLSIGKIPIVVPRLKKYNEHVNDHQLEFALEVEKRMNNIIVAKTEEEITGAILNYDKKIEKLNKNNKTNNKKFNDGLKKEINNIL